MNVLIWAAIIGLIGNILAQIIGQLVAKRRGRNAANDRKRILSISQDTHVIVNNQRTIMLRLIASLTKRIAFENPTDSDAQIQAHSAMKEANRASQELDREKLSMEMS